MRSITELVIHHSGGKTGSAELFRSMHKAKGWYDIGYHNVIGNGSGMPDGHIASGRKHTIPGAGVFGNNEGKLHVCLVGCFEKGDALYTGKPTYKQMCSLGHWLLVNAKKYGPDFKKPIPKIAGHREVAIPGHGTACPGNQTDLVKIRKWFAGSFPKYLSGQPFPLLGDYLEVHSSESKATAILAPVDYKGVDVDLTLVSTLKTAGLPDPVVRMKGLIIEDRAYIRVRDLIEHLGWCVVSSDDSQEVINLRTRP